MYEVKLWWATQAGDSFTAYLHMMKTAPGNRSPFAIAARRDGREHVAEVEIPGYPVWSESVLGLAARGLEAGGFRAKDVIRGGSLIDWPQEMNQVTLIDVSAALLPFGPGSPRELEGVFISVGDDSLSYRYRRPGFVGDLISQTSPLQETDAWAIALHVLCDLVWGATSVGPLPAPIKVPTYRWRKEAYVRVNEIPEPVQHEFARFLAFIDKPAIPSEPLENCARAKDWADFLSGKVYYETGFVPGLRFKVQF